MRRRSRSKVDILFAYISRRLGMMLLIVFGASYLAYNLQAYSADPLSQFGESTELNKETQMARLIRELHLDVPPPIRYFIWFRGIIAGLWGQFDLGETRSRVPVWEVISMAIPVTFRLVIASTILAIVLGITIGMVTAIRQYSRFDYTITFVSFLLFSLPIFWVAVLLKEYMAIQFNDFLENPQIPIPLIVVFSLISGFIMAGILGGSRRRFLLVFAGVTIGNAALLQYMSVTNWFVTPGIGIVGVAVFAGAFAVLVTQVSTGLDNRKSLISALSAAVIVTAGYYPLQLLMGPDADGLSVLLIFFITCGLSAGVAYFVDANDRRINVRTAIIAAFLGTLPLILDRFMREFGEYLNSDAITGRPVPTLGERSDLLSEEQMGNFWISGLDAAMHLILPTIALTLISFAGYVRFSRGSLLEVLNMDYIRTARAKGLTERTVIVRHGMRNAMLPLTTILVNDFAGVIGGAIITESVFAWKGMGSIFNESLRNYDLNLFMGVFLISASLTVMANFVADLLYGVVDPRIRIRK
jgi:peptide/nickel transport system permease protein